MSCNEPDPLQWPRYKGITLKFNDYLYMYIERGHSYFLGELHTQSGSRIGHQTQAPTFRGIFKLVMALAVDEETVWANCGWGG